MKLNFLWSAFFVSLFFSPVILAQPAKCPSINVIRTSQFSIVKHATGWFAKQHNQAYDTAEHWDFVAGLIQAENKEDAELKLLDGITKLEYWKGPIGSEKLWMCFYHNFNGKFTGVALTPVSNELNPVHHLQF